MVKVGIDVRLFFSDPVEETVPLLLGELKILLCHKVLTKIGLGLYPLGAILGLVPSRFQSCYTYDLNLRILITRLSSTF